MLFSIVLSVLALILPASPARAEEGCAHDARIVEACHDVTGYLEIHANLRPRLRIEDTDRLLGIVPKSGLQSGKEDYYWPDEIERVLTLDRSIRAKFRVCPFTPYNPGELQYVCIDSLVDVALAGDFLSPEEAPYCAARISGDMLSALYISSAWEERTGYTGYRNADGAIVFCRNPSEKAPPVFYGWLNRPYESREDWFYPLQLLSTEGGVLAVPGREATEVWLNGEPFLQGVLSPIINTAFHKEGKASLVLLSLEWDNAPWTETEAIPLYLADFGVVPPKIFKDIPLSIGAISWSREHRLPPQSRVSIEEKQHGVYIISGWTNTFLPKDSVLREYVYDRNKGTLAETVSFQP